MSHSQSILPISVRKIRYLITCCFQTSKCTPDPTHTRFKHSSNSLRLSLPHYKIFQFLFQLVNFFISSVQKPRQLAVKSLTDLKTCHFDCNKDISISTKNPKNFPFWDLRIMPAYSQNKSCSLVIFSFFVFFLTTGKPYQKNVIL